MTAFKEYVENERFHSLPHRGRTVDVWIPGPYPGRRGAECTWYDFWMGNSLDVSALIILAIAVLWVLGGAGSSGIQCLKPIA